MGAFILILSWIIVFVEAIWYFTCTEHSDVPLALVLLILILSMLPGFSVIMCIVLVAVLTWMVEEDVIRLKNNWFNRKFLAYHE